VREEWTMDGGLTRRVRFLTGILMLACTIGDKQEEEKNTQVFFSHTCITVNNLC
jgi:hypothetical protein